MIEDKKKKTKKENKQIVEVHIYVHIEGVPSYTIPTTQPTQPNTWWPPYVTYCGYNETVTT